jgi:hypothetical protein
MTRSPVVLWVLLALSSPAVTVAQQPTVRNPHGTLAQPCAVCHSPQAWKPARISSSFDHAKAARFPLEGAHAAVACKSCHTSLTFKEAPRDCVGCHTDPHRGELGTTCGRCHTMRSFVDRAEMGRAHQLTRFPLTGAHVAVDCEACHSVSAQGQMTFAARATDCNSCHVKDYQAARNPNHAAGGFPHDCQSCHVTVSWMGAKFDHNATRFPLTGAHVAVNCTQCHGTGGFGALPTACVSCHQTDYNNAKDPNHQQAQFPTDCTVCHSTVTWTSATFNHNTTRFPLTGAHVQATCAQCHGDGVYKGKPMACVSCHQTDYNNAKDPNHQQAQFSTDCTVCHTTTTWNGANFNHGTTSFPLTGAHVQLTCDQCHGDGVYKGKPMACVSCHQADYTRTTTPNHQQAQFPTDCTVCHTTTTWNGASFNHNSTSFPLTGAHIPLTCDQCHGDGVYKGKPTACVSCHQTDFNNTTNPSHQQAQFPTDCTLCHTTATWTSASFNHSTTTFPLTGAHVQATCAQCHGDGVYKGKPTACVSCHQTDYNTSTDPNHQAAQLPTDCSSCHTTTLWTGAQFAAHNANYPPYFPIYSGRHTQGVWKNCSTCHVNSSDYRVYDCRSCHQGAHNGRYPRLTCADVGCHANGRTP